MYFIYKVARYFSFPTYRSSNPSERPTSGAGKSLCNADKRTISCEFMSSGAISQPTKGCAETRVWLRHCCLHDPGREHCSFCKISLWKETWNRLSPWQISDQITCYLLQFFFFFFPQKLRYHWGTDTREPKWDHPCCRVFTFPEQWEKKPTNLWLQTGN